MTVSDLINRLQSLKDKLGDVEVTITDGYEALCYSGDFSVQEFFDDHSSRMTIDIGIGGTRQE